MLFIIFLLFTGCQEDDVFLPEISEVIENTAVTVWREKQNAWIFAQMRHNYFWTDQLMDSTDYDYSLEPSAFFKSMLVQEDRFSYCTRYEGYRPEVKGVDLNETVSFDSVYFVGDKRIGYFVYDEFETEADITDVILKFRRDVINELVIDLRDNPGGLVATCVHLASLILPSEHLGDLFCTYRYNRYLSDEYLKKTGSPFTKDYLNNDILTVSRNLNLQRVFCLVNGFSASCSELIINSLRPYMEVVVIGQTTRGKDVGMRTIHSSKYMYELVPITFRTYNALGDSVPVTGIVPDIYIQDIAGPPVGDVNEIMLKAALDYMEAEE